NAGANVDALRPYKGYAVIRVTGNEANSMYNGLQFSVNRRFAQGLSFGGAYTLSKTLDDGSGQRDVIPNAYDARNLWGPAGYDRRHVVVINGIYELPVFSDRSKWTGKVLGGWTLSAVSQMQTGTPFSIVTGDDFAGVGTGSGSQFWAKSGSPTITGQYARSNAETNFWFNIANSDGTPIFTRPANGTIVNDKVRNIIYNPGFQNHNLGLFKDFTIKEGHRITFRAEAFNWLNHPDWSGANGTPTNIVLDAAGKVDPVRSTFGKITGKGGNRELQFALRYQF
ncbi:MAG: TonB-dependent receptor, partial [Blastocatellia bacterium]